MTNYREILRLRSLGLNKTEIAASLGCARNTVAAALQRAEICGLKWPLPDGLSDRDLGEKLFPSAPGKPVYKMTDYSYVYREMQKSGVTLKMCRPFWRPVRTWLPPSPSLCLPPNTASRAGPTTTTGGRSRADRRNCFQAP